VIYVVIGVWAFAAGLWTGIWMYRGMWHRAFERQRWYFDRWLRRAPIEELEAADEMEKQL
jgi:hypothetical protein